MWFFPQRELDKERSLFIKVIVISFIAHACIVVSMFVGHVLFSGQLLVLGKGGAAPVSMRGARRKVQEVPGAGGPPPVQSAEQSQQKLPVPEKAQALPLPPAKNEAAEKKGDSYGKAQKKNKQKMAAAIPLFSELKKNYTSLKKKEKQPDTQKAEVQPVKNEVPKEIEKKIVPEPSKELISQAQGAQPVITEQLVSGNGSSQAPERLEFASDEPIGSDNNIVQEIQRHYRRPPGFDDHEPFVFTFEIKNGKATAIGPKGPEPLVIYSAVKEAVLKATFAVTKHTAKKELIVTSNC